MTKTTEIEAERERQRHRNYLDRRIPELQAMGKAHPGPSPEKATIEERMTRVVENAGTSRYPGRAAVLQAEAEYAAGAR